MMIRTKTALKDQLLANGNQLVMMIMMKLIVIVVLIQVVRGEISSGSVLLNKLTKVKPVGGDIVKNLIPLTEFPPPHKPQSGRRHLEDCMPSPQPVVVHDGPNVQIHGDYYDDGIAKTVATVIIPWHIDRKHFEVTTQVPYLTVGPIEAIGYHPSTIKSEHPSECEKIYQDHLADQYSESEEASEESLEMARMPVIAREKLSIPPSFMYSDEIFKLNS